jgi:hypothetical protein
MKYKIKIVKIVFVLCVLLSGMISCKKNTETPAPPAPPAPSTPMGAISFHIHSSVDTSEVMLSMPSMPDMGGMPVKDSSGRNIRLDIAQFYISGVTLKRADGSSFTLDKVYILKNIGQEDYLIGNVPAGNYVGVSFKVGLDAFTNATLPQSHASDSPLSAQKPSMNIQGKVDTSAKNNGSINWPISYQIGSNAQLQTVNLPAKQLVVVANGNQRMHLIADYAKILKGLNFKTQNTATPWDNPAISAQIAKNIPAMFRYEY